MADDNKSKRKYRRRKHYQSSSFNSSSSSDSELDGKSIERRSRKSKENRKPVLKKRVKWTNDDIHKLIDLYEARPCLWDVFCPEYHDRGITGKAKTEIEVSDHTFLNTFNLYGPQSFYQCLYIPLDSLTLHVLTYHNLHLCWNISAFHTGSPISWKFKNKRNT